jgi:hypothetical protein
MAKKASVRGGRPKRNDKTISASEKNMAINIAGTSVLRTGGAAGISLNLPQNPDFTVKFDPSVFQGALSRLTKTVVVSQDPAPGDFVPAGTAITVTVVEKSLIPVKSFNGLAAAVVDRFPNIGALEDDLSNPGDPVAANAKAALDKGVAFAQMSDADKSAVTNFVNSRFGQQADVTKPASDIAFLYQL